MSELPASWAIAPLDELLAAIVGGGTPSKSKASYFQGTIPFMTVKDMHARFIEDTQDHITQEALDDSASTLIPADTLVVATRMSLGKIARPKVALAINQDLKALFLNAGIDKTYVEYAWRSQESQIQAMGTGTTVKGIRLEDVRSLEFAVAPSTEQTRIADQLDALLARVQACNDRFDVIPGLLKRFRQAVLSAAVSGDLLVESPWNNQNKDLVTAFPLVQLVDVIAEPLRNGKSVRDGDGLPVLRLTALKADGVDITESKKGDWSEIPDASRFLIHDGDYLVSRGNGSKDFVGRGALVSDCTSDVAFPDTMIRFRPNTTRLLPNYLKNVWASESVRVQISFAAKTTTGIWKVSQTDLEAIFIPLPSIKQQTEIISRIKVLFALADQIEARYIAARAHAQRLTPLLLAKAFRGELVPQDPNDEPASALLQRIAAQRTQAALLPKPRKPRAARAVRAPKETAGMTKSRQDADVKDQPYLADHLRRIGCASTADALFKAAELPVADFYKQLAWEVANNHITDRKTVLEATRAS
jgi:type I restriction enzyme, S subunit